MIMIFIAFSCTLLSELLSESAPHPLKEEWITIFVHGTIGLRANLAVSTLIHLLQNDINNTLYKNTVEIIRDDPIFYQNQPIGKPGLCEIDMNMHVPGYAAGLCAQLYNFTAENVKPPETNHYYTFGWSGLISPLERYNAACDLYKALSQLLQEYAYKNITPKIRLLCYSHGGNTGLNIALARAKEFPQDTFYIDELILLGTPVQKETDYLVCHTLFKKIYHIYSRYDRIQRLDFFSFQRFFSQRRFATCTRYTLPEKLTQIEIQCFTPARYSFSQKKIVNRSPGHSELWFFGWPEHRHSSYRKYFPLYPIPIVCLLPAIIAAVEAKMPQEKHVILELNPHSAQTFLRKRHIFKKYKINCFSKSLLNRLKIHAESYKPLDYTRDLHQQHIDSAIMLASKRLNMTL